MIQIHILNDKQCRSRSVGFFRSQLIWIDTVCKGRTYLGSAGVGLSCNILGENKAYQNSIIHNGAQSFYCKWVLGFYQRTNKVIYCWSNYWCNYIICYIDSKMNRLLKCQRIFYGNVIESELTLTLLWANSADVHLLIFFLIFPKKRIWHFIQSVS